MKLFWHIAALGHWRDVVTDQLHCLKLGGWPENAAVLAAIAGDEEDVRFVEAAAAAAGIAVAVLQRSRVSDYEFPALTRWKPGAGEQSQGTNRSDTSTQREFLSLATLARTFWRLAMQRAVLIEFRERIAELHRGNAASGLTWHEWNGRSFYAGNFWWFWRSQLQALQISRSIARSGTLGRFLENNNRHAAEFWLGADPRGEHRSIWPHAQVSQWQWWLDHREAQQWALQRPTIVADRPQPRATIVRSLPRSQSGLNL